MSNVDNLIVDRYSEMLNLLRTLCECYDSTGKEYILLSISVATRVLLRDTFYDNGKPNSISLLTHMGKNNGKYLNTNTQNREAGIQLGLVRKINVGVNDGLGGEVKYWPLCDERYFPMQNNEAYLEFDEWLAEVIFQTPDASLPRRDLVLQMAHKDGGAHLSPKVQQKYDKFRNSWVGGS